MRFFLDSGAFSAFTRGAEINLDSYISFIKENSKYITVYANLDVIGDVEASWRNQRYMEEHGLHPLPVFHVEDPIEYLYECMKYDYFCLGGMASASTDVRVAFLDKCWYIICDNKDHQPRNKVHGFGMTSHKLMFRYPWYSVDSTSWTQTAGFGNIFIPRSTDKAEFDFTVSPYKISVSEESPGKSDYDAHIDTVTNTVRKHILKYLHLVNSTEAGVRASYWDRRYVNVTVFVGISKALTWPRTFKPKLINRGFGL